MPASVSAINHDSTAGTGTCERPSARTCDFKNARFCRARGVPAHPASPRTRRLSNSLKGLRRFRADIVPPRVVEVSGEVSGEFPVAGRAPAPISTACASPSSPPLFSWP